MLLGSAGALRRRRGHPRAHRRAGRREPWRHRCDVPLGRRRARRHLALLLSRAYRRVHDAGYELVNAHCVLIGERLKVADRRAEMVVRLAETLGVEPIGLCRGRRRIASASQAAAKASPLRPSRYCGSGLTCRPRRRARRGSAIRRPRDPRARATACHEAQGLGAALAERAPRTETACEAARSSGRARTTGGERTHPATRHPGQAHLAAEVHQRLRRGRPERAAAALDHAHDVGVHRQHRLAPREPAHRGRRVGADARKLGRSRRASRPRRRSARRGATRRHAGCTRGPGTRYDVVQPGAGERFTAGHRSIHASKRAPRVRPGLLEHHLRDEHGVVPLLRQEICPFRRDQAKSSSSTPRSVGGQPARDTGSAAGRRLGAAGSAPPTA